MLRKRPALLWLAFSALLLPLLSLSLFAQDFSAEFVNTGRGRSDSGPTRIYVSNNKMRVETNDRGEMGPGAAIMDFTNGKTIILLPQQKMYMESMPKMMQEHRMWFRPDDVDNACPQYEAMAKKNNPNDHVTCRKVGNDTVNGRPAVKYAGTSKNGSGFVWVDRKIRFVSKWQDNNGGGELQNIKEGAQSASLFVIPSDYHKFDMQQMMQGRRPQ